LAKRTAPLNTHVRMGPNLEPTQHLAIAKLRLRMSNIFKMLAPCRARSISNEKARMKGMECNLVEG
jgi:hypothetical protein